MGFEVLKSGVGLQAVLKLESELPIISPHYHHLQFFVPYSASVWLFSRVSPHVNHQHVLCLERLLLPRTFPPLADEDLLVHGDVVVVQVLRTKRRHLQLNGSGWICILFPDFMAHPRSGRRTTEVKGM